MSSSTRYGTNSQNTSQFMTDLINEFIKNAFRHFVELID